MTTAEGKARLGSHTKGMTSLSAPSREEERMICFLCIRVSIRRKQKIAKTRAYFFIGIHADDRGIGVRRLDGGNAEIYTGLPKELAAMVV